MTPEHFMAQFDKSAKEIYDSNIPEAKEGSKGTIAAMVSFMGDLYAKQGIINSSIKELLSNILTEAGAQGIDIEELEGQLTKIALRHHGEWVKTHKPS